jgi:UDP-glucose 4-epimerase
MSIPDTWQGYKVLITGGSGFLGSHLCRRLTKLGAEVHATSRAHRVSEPGGPIWWRTDLASIQDVRKLLTDLKPMAVFHLAGAAGAQPDLQLVLPTVQGLIVSAVNVLVAVTEAGCGRIVMTGSLTEPARGEPVPIPSSPYAAAKWTSSAYARMFHLLYKTPTVVLTPFMTFGPYQDRSKLIPSVILALLRGESPRLSSGMWEVDWIFVEDIIDAFLAVARAPDIEGGCFDLGTGTRRTVRSVVEKIALLMNVQTQPLFGIVADRPSEPVRSADTVQAYERLRWRAQTSLEEGLQQTIAWYATRAHAGSE